MYKGVNQRPPRSRRGPTPYTGDLHRPTSIGEGPPRSRRGLAPTPISRRDVPSRRRRRTRGMTGSVRPQHLGRSIVCSIVNCMVNCQLYGQLYGHRDHDTSDGQSYRRSVTLHVSTAPAFTPDRRPQGWAGAREESWTIWERAQRRAVCERAQRRAVCERAQRRAVCERAQRRLPSILPRLLSAPPRVGPLSRAPEQAEQPPSARTAAGRGDGRVPTRTHKCIYTDDRERERESERGLWTVSL